MSNNPTSQRSTTMRHRGGFTLIEILLALTLGAVVVATAINLFQNNKRASRAIESLSRLQESARFAIDFITTDLRRAGFRGCLSMAPGNIGTTVFQYALNDHSWYDYRVPVEGFNGASNAWNPSLPNELSAAIGSNPPPTSGTDVLTIRLATRTNTRLSSAMSTQNASLLVDEASAWQANDIAILSTCNATAVTQITGSTTTGTPAMTELAHDANSGNAPQNSTDDLGTAFDSGADIYRAIIKSYYVAPSSDDPQIPALWVVTHPRLGGTAIVEQLIDGVENMQVFYGIDTDDDGSPNRFINPSMVADWHQVVAVQIELLLQTLEDQITDSPQGYIFAGSTVTNPGDHKLRRTFATTIGVRNRLN